MVVKETCWISHFLDTLNGQNVLCAVEMFLLLSWLTWKLLLLVFLFLCSALQLHSPQEETRVLLLTQSQPESPKRAGATWFLESLEVISSLVCFILKFSQTAQPDGAVDCPGENKISKWNFK